MDLIFLDEVTDLSTPLNVLAPDATVSNPTVLIGNTPPTNLWTRIRVHGDTATAEKDCEAVITFEDGYRNFTSRGCEIPEGEHGLWSAVKPAMYDVVGELPGGGVSVQDVDGNSHSVTFTVRVSRDIPTTTISVGEVVDMLVDALPIDDEGSPSAVWWDAAASMWNEARS